MTRVGTYVRDLGASLDRLIENALDWEHLPYVHGDSFGSIAIIEAGEHGWRAETELGEGRTVMLDLRLDDDRLGWVTETRESDVLLSRIESRVEPTGTDSCRVTVEFTVPGLAPDRAESAGAYYCSLYARLYDEDEALMIARAGAIRAGAAAHRERRTVTLADGSAHEIPRVCPHQGLPLDAEPDAHGIITCPWHGYRFDAVTGRCVSGQGVGWART